MKRSNPRFCLGLLGFLSGEGGNLLVAERNKFWDKGFRSNLLFPLVLASGQLRSFAVTDSQERSTGLAHWANPVR